MQFGYTILYVEDVPATVAFYEAAFGLSRRFVHEEGDFGEMDTGATALAFSSLKLMARLGKNPQRAVAGAPHRVKSTSAACTRATVSAGSRFRSMACTACSRAAVSTTTPRCSRKPIQSLPAPAGTP